MDSCLHWVQLLKNCSVFMNKGSKFRCTFLSLMAQLLSKYSPFYSAPFSSFTRTFQNNQGGIFAPFMRICWICYSLSRRLAAATQDMKRIYFTLLVLLAKKIKSLLIFQEIQNSFFTTCQYFCVDSRLQGILIMILQKFK